MKKLLSATLFLTLVASALRVLVVVYDVEPLTGFYSSLSARVILFYVLVILVTVGSVFSRFLYKKQPPDAERAYSGGAVQATAFILLGNAFLVETAVKAYSLLTSETQQASSLISILVAALSALALYAMTPACLGKKRPRGDAVLSLAPVLWVGFGLVLSFLKYTTLANISEYMLDVAMMVFALLYFFSEARARAGLSDMRDMVTFGPATLFLIGTYLLPKLFFTLMYNRPESYASLFGRPMDVFYQPFDMTGAIFLLAIPYIVVNLLVFSKKRNAV